MRSLPPALALVALASGAAIAQGASFVPRVADFRPDMAARLKAPAGFSVSLFASGLGNPRMLAMTPEGRLYAARRATGDVVLLTDSDHDGKADGAPRVVARGLRQANGLALRGKRLYIAAEREVVRADIRADGTLGAPVPVLTGLPPGGRHPNRTVGFGPDGRLYTSIGSSTNAEREPDAEYAVILVSDADGKGRRVFARGLRNTIGFDWHPGTRAMWGMDHGSDGRGDDLPPEELNELVDGGDYGWPFCFAARRVDPLTAFAPPGGKSKEAYCAGTRPPALTAQAHSSPLGFMFYRGTSFPAEYRNDAIVAFRGSWNRSRPVGYQLARVRFENGRPKAFEPFVTGFLSPDGKTVAGRPVGLALAPDGSVIFSDDTNGAIYRLAYKER